MGPALLEDMTNLPSSRILRRGSSRIHWPAAAAVGALTLAGLSWSETAKAENTIGVVVSFNNTLSGMVTPNSFEPRAAWWAYKAYADGVNSRVLSQSDNDRVVALASKSNPEGNAQVLLGYFDRNYSSATTVTLNLRNLPQLGIQSGQKIRLKLEKIPNNQERAVQKLVTVKEESVSVVRNDLNYVIPNFNVHEGYLLTVSK